MKKSLFMMAVCTVALSACTSQEVIEEGIQSNAIGFQQVVNKESRALDNTNLKNFYVYGYYTKANEVTPVNVFNGVNVHKLNEVDATTQSIWKYDDTRYWVPGMTYQFYAYSCEDQAFSTGKGNAVMDLEGTSRETRALMINDFVCDVDHQHDLIFAASDPMEAKGTGNSKVAFKFSHILTRLNVVFTSEFAAGYKITVSDAKLTRFRDQGDFDYFSSPKWKSVTYSKEKDTDITPVPFSIPATGNVAAVATTDSPEQKVTTGYVYAIPYVYDNGDAVAISFKISVASDNGEVVLTRELSGTWSPNWVIGTSYTYNIKITGTAAKLEPIVFETSENMNDWTPGTTSSVSMTFSAN